MDRCRGIKRDGTPCRGYASAGDGYCWAHHPGRVEERQYVASKAGRASGGVPSPARVCRGVVRVLEALEADGISAQAANAYANLSRVLLAAHAEQRQQREQDEILERLEQLERRNAIGRGGRTWG